MEYRYLDARQILNLVLILKVFYLLCLPFYTLLRGINEISFDNRRQRKDREIANLANGINFQYTSPFMSESQSLVKQEVESRCEGY